MIFGVLNPEKIWHDTLTGLSTSPVRCSYITLGNPKKVIFQQYYDDDDDVVTVVVLPESCPARPSGVNLLGFRSKTYSACRTRNPSHLYSTELPSRRALKSTKRSHLAAVAACSRSAITTPTTKCPASLKTGRKVLFCSLAVLDPRVCHTMDVPSSFIFVLCHSDWLFHVLMLSIQAVRGLPRFRTPCNALFLALPYLIFQATHLFPHGVTIVC